jgi:hypothetical protein
MKQDHLQGLLHLPLSEEAYDQFNELDIILQSLQLIGEKDSWSYIWGNDKYSSRKAYKHLLGSQQVQPDYGWIWKYACQMKHKVFFWLLVHDRLNTRDMLRKKHMHLEYYTCELYMFVTKRRKPEAPILHMCFC